MNMDFTEDTRIGWIIVIGTFLLAHIISNDSAYS